jgi:hypothetical protein
MEEEMIQFLVRVGPASNTTIVLPSGVSCCHCNLKGFIMDPDA